MTTVTRCDKCGVEREVHSKHGLVGWVIISVYPGSGSRGVRDEMRSLDLCQDCAKQLGVTDL